MLQRIIQWWDRLVYKLAYPSLRRMFCKEHGVAYLFELHLQRYRAQNPIPHALKRNVESFMDTINDLDNI